MKIKTTMRYISSHNSQNSHDKKKKSTNNKCWRDVEKREPSCTVGGNLNGYSHYGERYGDFIKTGNKTTI